MTPKSVKVRIELEFSDDVTCEERKAYAERLAESFREVGIPAKVLLGEEEA